MRRGLALLAAGVAALAGLHVSVVAQTFNVERMQSYMNSDVYKALIGQALSRVPPTVFRRCPTLVSASSKTMMLQPISFSEKGPNAGAWKQSFPVSGCGNDTTLNIYFFASADGNIRTVVGLPGTTQAELVLQRDTLLSVNAAAGLRVKDCKTLAVTNTRFEGFGLKDPPTPDPGQGARFRPWWETWTVSGCDKTTDLPINFVPDATGTGFSIVTKPMDRK